MTKLDSETKARLLRAAELNETEVPESATKKEIIVALMDDGVDEEYYYAFLASQLDAEAEAEAVSDEPVAPAAPKGTITTADLGNARDAKVEVVEEEEEAYEPDSDSDETLIRYTGFSRLYQKMGYNFRKDHPFVPVKNSDLEKLLSVSDLFRIASPKEAQDFYA